MSTTFATSTWVLVGALLYPPGAAAQEPACSVPVFRGAARPQGGDAEMRVVNTGRACGIRNFGQFPDAASLAFAGEITAAPKNGVARFEAPRALYTPARGFVGEDSFEYLANAKGPNDSPVLLKVRVKVIVTAE